MIYGIRHSAGGYSGGWMQGDGVQFPTMVKNMLLVRADTKELALKKAINHLAEIKNTYYSQLNVEFEAAEVIE
jgi:hypothetical protein